MTMTDFSLVLPTDFDERAWVVQAKGCFANALLTFADDTAWMLTATALVLLMTLGLSFFFGGMVDRRNVLSTMLQSFIAMGLVSILWGTVGFSLAFGDSLYGLIGDPRTFLMFRNVGEAPHAALLPTIPLALFALFQLKFAITVQSRLRSRKGRR